MRRTASSRASFVAQQGLLWIGAMTLVAIAGACSSSLTPANPASPSVSTAAVPASQGFKTVPREVTGKPDGAFTFEMYYPYGDYDFIAHGEATGTLSHLGLSKLYTTHQANPAGDGTLLNTAFKIVAANGDEIHGTYADAKVTLVGVDVGTDPLFYFHYKGKATLEITGGTGRFAGASGAIDATFLEDIEVFDPYWANYNCTVAWTLAGTVNY